MPFVTFTAPRPPRPEPLNHAPMQVVLTRGPKDDKRDVFERELLVSVTPADAARLDAVLPTDRLFAEVYVVSSSWVPTQEETSDFEGSMAQAMPVGFIKPPATSARVKGHTLVGEGRPYTKDGKMPVTSSDAGHGRCSCGSTSERLHATAARKQWHREHKAAMLALVYTKNAEPVAMEVQDPAGLYRPSFAGRPAGPDIRLPEWIGDGDRWVLSGPRYLAVLLRDGHASVELFSDSGRVLRMWGCNEVGDVKAARRLAERWIQKGLRDLDSVTDEPEHLATFTRTTNPLGQWQVQCSDHSRIVSETFEDARDFWNEHLFAERTKAKKP